MANDYEKAGLINGASIIRYDMQEYINDFPKLNKLKHLKIINRKK